MPKGGKPYTFKSQGYNARLDESLGARRGKKSQSLKARRDESKGMSKARGGRAYGAVRTMDR